MGRGATSSEGVPVASAPPGPVWAGGGESPAAFRETTSNSRTARFGASRKTLMKSRVESSARTCPAARPPSHVTRAAARQEARAATLLPNPLPPCYPLIGSQGAELALCTVEREVEPPRWTTPLLTPSAASLSGGARPQRSAAGCMKGMLEGLQGEGV